MYIWKAVYCFLIAKVKHHFRVRDGVTVRVRGLGLELGPVTFRTSDPSDQWTFRLVTSNQFYKWRDGQNICKTKNRTDQNCKSHKANRDCKASIRESCIRDNLQKKTGKKQQLWIRQLLAQTQTQITKTERYFNVSSLEEWNYLTQSMPKIFLV